MMRVTTYLEQVDYLAVAKEAVEQDRTESAMVRHLIRSGLGGVMTPGRLKWESFGQTRHVVVVLWGEGEAEAACGFTGTISKRAGAQTLKACSRCASQLERLLEETAG